jgi:hypothetical protein
MDKSTSVYVKRKAVMGWSKSTVFWGAILSTAGLCTWTGPARASCDLNSRAEVIGQMPDLIFLTGQSSTVQSLDFWYTGVVGGDKNCKINIHSNIPGVGLNRSTLPLQFGDVQLNMVIGNEIGASVDVGSCSISATPSTWG